MKIQFKPTINGYPVSQVFMSPRGIGLFAADDSDEVHLVDEQGNLLATMSVNAYSGEGGGGSIEVEAAP